MLGARLSRDGYDKEYFILFNEYKLSGLRIGNKRPNAAYIFQISNSSNIYSEVEIEKFKKIYYNEIVNYLDAKNNKITYQNKEIENLFKLEK